MKKALKIFAFATLAIVLALALASCDGLDDLMGSHTHKYGEWETTKNPTCTEDGEKSRSCECGDKHVSPILASGHKLGEDGICTVCGKTATESCTHETLITIKGTPSTCTASGSSDYKVCNDCGAVIRKAVAVPPAHSFTLGVCSECGTVCTHENTKVIEGYSSSCHYQGLSDGEKCADCGTVTKIQEQLPYTGHEYGDNGTCELCGQDKYGSSSMLKAEILIQLYENDNYGELSSGLKRYYAGQDSSNVQEIDQLVRERNANAADATNVKAAYTYETSYGWGACVDKIVMSTMSGSSSAPDIYASFSYDMTSAALRGCFANLYANTDVTSTTYGNGNNYFSFTEEGYEVSADDYFESNAGRGYFFDYMQSLTFANEAGVHDKMYLVASNYTIDAIRAMEVVPINIELLEQINLNIPINPATGETMDADGNGYLTIDDFYQLVWDGDWTYDALASISKSIYTNTNTTIATSDILDTLGFCAGTTSGLTSSALLYSSPVKIINKVENNGVITYEYPATNQELNALSSALYDLFYNSDGVCTLSSEEAIESGLEVKGDLDAIRTQFAQNKVLFGGVTMIGSLEDTVYQEMNATGMKGFGLAPIPLYTQDENHTVEYNTLIHNLARVVAISKSTTEFEQCSAFLDYQSINSADIVDMYCENNLISATSDGYIETWMFNFIKNNAHTAFDKTYDDIITSRKIDSSASAKRWHTIFSINRFNVPNMSTRYSEIYPENQGILEDIIAEWGRLD